MIRRTVGVIALSIVNLFIGCEDVNHIEPIEFELIAGLPQDNNGYYHYAVANNTNQITQTLHRISGKVTRNEEPIDVIKFGWESSLHWSWDGYQIRIVNGASYSNINGEVNTMMAVTSSLIGDTATIRYGYHDNWTGENTYGEFYVIFEDMK